MGTDWRLIGGRCLMSQDHKSQSVKSSDFRPGQAASPAIGGSR